MPQAAKKAVDEWREADARAREAELALVTARYQFLSGSAPEPPPELQAEARLLRKLADAKLKTALAAFGASKR